MTVEFSQRYLLVIDFWLTIISFITGNGCCIEVEEEMATASNQRRDG